MGGVPNWGQTAHLGLLLAGMMLGGGCGQELAHWIVHGRPEKDMYSYDIRQACARPLTTAVGLRGTMEGQ